MNLNLGCGYKKLDGYINIDNNPSCFPDMLIDLEKAKLPFKDKSIDTVYSSHVLEHIRNIRPLLLEIRRVLKKDGLMVSIVPYFNSVGAYQDPTHVRFFSKDTMSYFEDIFTSEQEYIPTRFGKIFPKRIRLNASLVLGELISQIRIISRPKVKP